MHEDAVKRQQRQYMIYNLVAFTIIFGLFGGIIYMQIRTSLFAQLDEDLYSAREMICENKFFVDQQLAFGQLPPQEGNRFHAGQGKAENFIPQDKPEENIPPPEEPGGMVGNRRSIPMRVQIILRDADGAVQKSYALGRLFWEDMVDNIPFSPERLDSIQVFRMEDGSYYRSLLFQHHNETGEAYYIQLMTSADGEMIIIGSFLKILIICITVFVLLSIIASYVLTQKSMAPLLLSWKRQTEFVENASHELRTPLTIIQNKLEALLVTPNATILEKADNVAISLSETRRLSKLTSDLMTLARADSSEPQLQKKPFDLDELIQVVAGPYGELAEAQEKEMELKLNCETQITADRSRIHELMVILLDNALKYTREGDRICISTSIRDNRVFIRVADTGIGIGEEHMDRIFDRFYREDKARSREKGGSGLGLSIASWIVGIHGGSIRAEKNQPAGTVFIVKLPC